MTMVEGTIDDRVRLIWSFLAFSRRSGIDSYIFGSILGDTTICLFFWILFILMACTHAICIPSFLFNEYDTRIAPFRPTSPVMNDTRYFNYVFSYREGTRTETFTY